MRGFLLAIAMIIVHSNALPTKHRSRANILVVYADDQFDQNKGIKIISFAELLTHATFRQLWQRR